MSVDAIRKAHLFAAADDAELEWLAAHATVREHKASAMVIQHLEPDDDVYFILEGQTVAVLVSPEGREVAFDIMRAGDCFGEIAALDGQTRSASVIALTDVKVASLSATMFREAMGKIPSANARLVGLLVSRIRRLTARNFESLTLKVKNRVRLELVRLAAQAGAKQGDTVKKAPTHSQIAARIGANREAVTREMNALTQDNVIATKRGEITFLKLDDLVASAAASLEVPISDAAMRGWTN